MISFADFALQNAAGAWSHDEFLRYCVNKTEYKNTLHLNAWKLQNNSNLRVMSCRRIDRRRTNRGMKQKKSWGVLRTWQSHVAHQQQQQFRRASGFAFDKLNDKPKCYCIFILHISDGIFWSLMSPIILYKELRELDQILCAELVCGHNCSRASLSCTDRHISRHGPTVTSPE